MSHTIKLQEWVILCEQGLAEVTGPKVNGRSLWSRNTMHLAYIHRMKDLVTSNKYISNTPNNQSAQLQASFQILRNNKYFVGCGQRGVADGWPLELFCMLSVAIWDRAAGRWSE